MTLADIKFGDMNKDPPPPPKKKNMLLRVILTVTLNSTFVFFIMLFSHVLFQKISYFVNMHYFCLVNTLHSVYTTYNVAHTI